MNEHAISWFFPRSAGPLVSILIASRQRTGHLLQALDSLVSLAHDPAQLEFVLKLDSDDNDTITAIIDLRRRLPQLNVQAIITPRGRGYLEMGSWVNLMADRATGDWLYLFNDDARMQSQDWDKRLLGLYLPTCWHICPEDVLMLTTETNGDLNSNEFILLRRRTYELLARRFPTPYVDSWLYESCTLAKSLLRTGLIQVEHLRTQVKDSVRTDTDNNFHEGVTSLVSTGPILGQISDGMRLLSYIEEQMTTNRFFAAPDGPGWYFWRGSPIHAGLHILVDGDNNAHVLAREEKTVKKASELHGMWYPRVTAQGRRRWTE